MMRAQSSRGNPAMPVPTAGNAIVRKPFSAAMRKECAVELRRAAAVVAPPKIRSLLAALTMASVSISVRSPCVRMIFSSRVMATSSRRIGRADESRGFAHDDYFFAHAAAHFAASFDGVAGRGGREDNFEKPALGRGMEETHPDALLRTKRDGGHIRNGERRRTAGKDRAGLCESVEQREYLDLDLHFLRNSFDHEIGVAASLFDGSRR